ncbi:MAG TPA: class I SAM-dependent methyltransferase [Pseudonocardiaceae bacterium]|nr:class I SAM-dependent methyltransferase [Pseudonocardiaceae bacterium]
MAGEARVRELMMGIEGLALLRNAIDGDEEFLTARVAEMRKIIDSAGGVGEGATLAELDVAAGYAAWASTYDSKPNFILAVEEPVAESLLARIPPGLALDAACGTGRHTATLVRYGHEVIGVDQSPEMLAQAAAKVPGAQFRVGDVTKLPIPDASLDLVLCALALSHLHNVGEAIAEFRRVLRPGGRLIVTDIHPIMVLLTAQLIFAYKPGELAFVRIRPHQVSDHLTAFATHGFSFISCHEPLYAGPLPPGGYEEKIPDAARAAWNGIPSAIIYEMQAST